MNHKRFLQFTSLILVLMLTLLGTTVTSASSPRASYQAPLALQYSTNAILNNHEVIENGPAMYTIDFKQTFVSITEVDYYFVFADDLLDQWEWLQFTGDFPGGFGFINPNPLPQTSRLLTIPCSVHPEVCDAFMDGYSQGEISISLFTGTGSPSVNISSMTVYVYGTTFIDVTVDIKPDSETNPINIKSKGKTPVAILSTEDFDAPSMVDTSSLTFGKTGDESSLAFCDDEPVDVNGDGTLDLVCYFYTKKTGFQVGDLEGILKGKTIDNLPLEGSDNVRIMN